MYLSRIFKLNFLFILAMLSGLSFASETDSAQLVFQKTPADRLYDIDMRGPYGVAVGENGLLLKTRDSGETWLEQEMPTNLALINVAISRKGIIAVGQLGEILVKDGSQDWKKIGFDTTLRLLGVDVNDNGLAIAVGAFGTLLRSHDNGLTWHQLTPPWAELYDSGTGDTAVIRDEPTNYVVHVFNDNRVIIGGEYGQLLTSLDGGDSWQLIYRFPEENGVIAPTIFDIKFYGKKGYAVGQAGLVLVSDDGGKSWAPASTSVKGSLFAVSGDDQGKIFAIGQRIAMASQDSGQTWARFEPLDISLNWYAGVSQSGNRVYAVGHSGRMLSLQPY